ncbi:MAG: hypothetical protein P4L64_08395 [Caulobacteraceae bacterium]|nr:hypothetical protein [Caulobacteraceae bacterium]
MNGPNTADDLEFRLNALDIDVRCAAAYNRAVLTALAAISRNAREAVAEALLDEAEAAGRDDSIGSGAVRVLLLETLRSLDLDAPARAPHRIAA